jgi:hypothetical protein
MTREDIKSVVVEVLTEVVAAVGADMPPLDDDTKPIGALPNFDSILAEDTTVVVFTRLGLEADLDVNPFIKDERAATLGEVVDQLHALAPDGGQA